MYFIFKPVSLVSFSLVLVVPLLRLFDIGNIATGSSKRALTRLSRFTVALACGSCFLASIIACWYGAEVSSRLRYYYLSELKTPPLAFACFGLSSF